MISLTEDQKTFIRNIKTDRDEISKGLDIVQEAIVNALGGTVLIMGHDSIQFGLDPAIVARVFRNVANQLQVAGELGQLAKNTSEDERNAISDEFAALLGKEGYFKEKRELQQAEGSAGAAMLARALAGATAH